MKMGSERQLWVIFAVAAAAAAVVSSEAAPADVDPSRFWLTVYTGAAGDANGEGASSSLSVRGIIETRQEFALALACADEDYCAHLDSEHAVVYLEMDGGGRSDFIHFDPEAVACDDHNLQQDCVLVLGFGHEDNHTVAFNASMLGIYEIRFYSLVDGTKKYFTSKEEEEADPIPITLRLVMARDMMRTGLAINISFTIIMLIALFLMGLEIDLRVVLATLKRPIGPAIGFFSQFVFMPLIAWGVGELLLEQDYEKLGLILLGSSPGGSNSNFWTAVLGGDVNLSVTMTLVSSVASFGMTPLWVFLIGRQYSQKDIPIPYHMIAMSLITFVIPLSVGSLYKYKRPAQAERVNKLISRPFFLVCLVVLPVAGSMTNLYYFYLVSWRHLVAGLLMGVLGYSLGGLLAWACRQQRPQIIAISLETAIQNGGIAFVVLTLTFPSPYSELGLLPVISFFFCSTGPILFVAYAIYETYRCSTGKTTSCQEWVDNRKKLNAKARGTVEAAAAATPAEMDLLNKTSPDNEKTDTKVAV